jgi:large subunit ribosomal protein L20
MQGQFGSRHRLWRRSNEAMLKSYWYAYRDRRTRKRNMRRLWIIRINAAARQHGTTYSRLMAGLRKAEVSLNRKMLADLAVRDPQAFAVVAETAKAQ